MIKRNYDCPGKRLRQLERVLLIIELLSPLRYGATLGELTRDVGDALDADYCERTIRRDLKALEEMGFVEVRRTGELRRGGGWRTARWQWMDQSFRSAIFSHVAAVRSEARDPMPLEAGR